MKNKPIKTEEEIKIPMNEKTQQIIKEAINETTREEKQIIEISEEEEK